MRRTSKRRAGRKVTPTDIFEVRPWDKLTIGTAAREPGELSPQELALLKMWDRHDPTLRQQSRSTVATKQAAGILAATAVLAMTTPALPCDLQAFGTVEDQTIHITKACPDFPAEVAMTLRDQRSGELYTVHQCIDPSKPRLEWPYTGGLGRIGHCSPTVPAPYTPDAWKALVTKTLIPES